MRLGDDYRIGQIIGNLVSNAVKFTDTGLTSIGAKKLDDEWVEFWVKDTGIGIAKDHLPRVLKEFEQIDSSNARLRYGAGLGLAIVSKLVELMAGTLYINSSPGSGTEITIRLKLPNIAPSKNIEQLEPKADLNPEDLAGLRVLVAEDNSTNTLILKRMLKSLGVKAVFTCNGNEACEAWEGGDFNVLLFDIAMPMLDGIEALKEISEKAAIRGLSMPYAIAATANILKDQESSYLAAGFSEVLPKPFRQSELSRVLQKASSVASSVR